MELAAGRETAARVGVRSRFGKSSIEGAGEK
jgi:hypothetical protein